MTDPIIRLSGIDKFYGDFQALYDVNAEIRTGEFFSLLGPSGCGKTTLLRTIAGFEDVSAGKVEIAGQSMENVPANRRPTNMVFQSYAIFPHMTVAENVAYGLKARKMPKDKIATEVATALKQVGLEGYGDRASHAMSGGQRQRVALARALVLKPKVLLLDEPLSALDKKMREQMQSELRHLQRAVGITFILVTHDQEEALTMSDRIAVMFEGRIGQLASPQDLYRRPVNRKVAEFIGVMNFLDVSLSAGTAGTFECEIAGLGKAIIPAEQAPGGVDASVTAGVRPEMLTILSGENARSEREASGIVEDVYYYGDMTYYDVKLDGVDHPVTISMRNTAGRAVLSRQDRARVGWGAESVLLLK
ncbi:ABC transporter ATP-binding protein [Neptunicoccus cionae]|uniref:ABC transporter ATP-binding protein n=1 Tax=Neptunicoccus cionae TaxID=2035344 RepID=UPI000C75B3DB|nr:ABC transporter ATP-binding protein [Amylibacter cionae]PLS23001.1 Fe3+/spermidine/putrescine ABC transporter ATP-binding protein [Amylibacter cionae]